MPAGRLAATLLVLWMPAGAVADERDPRAQARELALQSFAEFQRAERLADGWSAAYDRGIDLAERAIALDPRNADAHYALFVNLGRKSERTSTVAQARSIGRLKELLARALELDPGHAHAWEAEGEMLMRLPWLLGGSEPKGLEALEHAAELEPTWSKPPLRLAEHWWKEGERERARGLATKARDLARAESDSDNLGEAEALLREIDAGGN
jgi:tetratricopeptide (TPR) repeat protein